MNTTKIKIAIFDMDNMKNPHWAGGQARVTYETGKRLSKKHEVKVYCSKYPGWKNYILDNISYIHIGLGSKYPKLNNFIYITSIGKIALRLKADIIIEDFVAPFSVCFTPLYTKIPVIGRGSFFAPGEMLKKYKLPFDIVLKIGIKIYKYFIALNINQVKIVEKLNPKINTRLIYNGVDSKNFEHNIVDGDYILYMGRIDLFHKGLDLLLEAYFRASSEINEYLYIMGTGSEEEIDKILKLIKKFNLFDRVKILGKKNGDEKDQIIMNSKFMVFPSRYEGHSLGSLESLSFGKPFIYFDIPGFEWVKKDVSINIAAYNVEEYKNSIIELSKNNILRKSMSAKAREFSKQFDWDEVTKKYEDYIYQIINKKI